MPPDRPVRTGAATAQHEPFAAALAAARRRVRLRLGADACLSCALLFLAALGIAEVFARSGAASPSRMTLAWSCALGALVISAWMTWRRRHEVSSPAVAAGIERHSPHAMNLVITAEALVRGEVVTSDPLAERILVDATDIVRTDNGTPFASTRRLVTTFAAVIVAISASAGFVSIQATPRDSVGSLPTLSADAASTTPAGDIEVRVVPPAYAGRAATSSRNPERLEVLAGSRVELLPSNDASSMVAWLNGRALPRSSRGTPVSVHPADDGSLVVEVRTDDVTERHAIPVTVNADPSPVVTITRPGRDLLIADVAVWLDLEIRARDDLALTSLRLRYTKVSGSGEQFEFVEGDLPVIVTASSATSWSGRARIDLSAHRLVPGDLVAYRAVARDGRPTGDEGASDTYVIRVAQPGDVASAGFAIDEDENKFALSQQMLLIKTERLHAERARLAPDDFSGRASGLAVEQRMIRHEFSFMVGGEVEDEEEEAAHSHELQEGRDDNRGRRDVLSAIRAMSRAEQSLLRANTADALPHERDAVEALQRAFSRTRYLLRTLPIRARIDLERRLSGDPRGSASSRRSAVPTADRERVAAALRAIAGLDEVSRDLRGIPTPAQRRRLLDVASAIASIDVRSTSLAEAARLVLAATRPGATPDAEAAKRALDRAAEILGNDARSRLAAPLAIEGTAPAAAPRAASRASPAAGALGRRP